MRIIKDGRERLTIQLTYADCDPMGIIYFASWFPWMERLLSAWLYSEGLRSDETFEGFGFTLVTRQAECEYLHPAALFETIVISIDSAKIGNSSVQWSFLMERVSDHVVVARGRITWVTINGDGVAIKVPATLRDAVSRNLVKA